jgi:hypothetical protein
MIPLGVKTCGESEFDIFEAKKQFFKVFIFIKSTTFSDQNAKNSFDSSSPCRKIPEYNNLEKFEFFPHPVGWKSKYINKFYVQQLQSTDV